jgi:hypothetical protein
MSARRHLVGPGALIAVVVATIALGTASPLAQPARADRVLERAPLRTVESPEAAAVSVVTEPPPTTTTAAPTTTTAPPTTTTAAAPAPKFTLDPYKGLGAWLDVYDWSTYYTRGGTPVGLEAVDTLAAQGVQTIFIQASKWDAPVDVLEPGRLQAFIDRAHEHGMKVVGWYLPTLEDPNRDLQRMLAIAAMTIDGLAVDIESRKVGDVAERNRRLVEVSTALRNALPGQVIGAVPLEPVLLEDVNPRFWPAFPWAEIAPSYDVWLPMAYWTNRRGDLRDAYRYTAENIDRLRARIGRPDAPVHALGGIGDLTTELDLIGFHTAAAERGAIGGSIYDFRTTAAPHWPHLQLFRTAP